MSDLIRQLQSEHVRTLQNSFAKWPRRGPGYDSKGEHFEGPLAGGELRALEGSQGIEEARKRQRMLEMFKLQSEYAPEELSEIQGAEAYLRAEQAKPKAQRAYIQPMPYSNGAQTPGPYIQKGPAQPGVMGPYMRKQ